MESTLKGGIQGEVQSQFWGEAVLARRVGRVRKACEGKRHEDVSLHGPLRGNAIPKGLRSGERSGADTERNIEVSSSNRSGGPCLWSFALLSLCWECLSSRSLPVLLP